MLRRMPGVCARDTFVSVHDYVHMVISDDSIIETTIITDRRLSTSRTE